MMKQKQEIIEILTDSACSMCHCNRFAGDDKGPDHAEIRYVTKQITLLFQPVQKEMRSRHEQVLDAAFERMDVKPRVYHFTKDVGTFNAVTVALAKRWEKEVTEEIVKNCVVAVHNETENKATSLIIILRQARIYGIAVCDRHDQFNKRRGRMIAKGRLMQYLLLKD